MKTVLIFVVALILSFSAITGSNADQTVTVRKIDNAPVIDGRGQDPCWEDTLGVVTHDDTGDIDIELKAVYTDNEIFFRVNFPDPDRSGIHKGWIWDQAEEMYVQGPDREDVFVLKWNMELQPVDLSLKGDNEYTADIWFWKANRTDPAGYADDKYQNYSAVKSQRSTKLTTRSGRTMYLVRKGDSGTSAYETVIYSEYVRDKMPRYTNKVPTGSRSDIKAKGVWLDGRWTVEFGRALYTGNDDDIQFDTDESYLFGVSRYEVAGRKPERGSEQPLYGSGDISEALTLQFGNN